MDTKPLLHMTPEEDHDPIVDGTMPDFEIDEEDLDEMDRAE